MDFDLNCLLGKFQPCHLRIKNLDHVKPRKRHLDWDELF